jgi:hypothetical protein
MKIDFRIRNTCNLPKVLSAIESRKDMAVTTVEDQT